MLTKLLKYDLKWSYKFLSIFYLLSLILTGFSKLFLSFENSFLIHLIGKICLFATLILLVVTIINNILSSFIRFVKNIYKDEAYLTHTLPVSEKNIFLSKVLSSIITLLTSFLIGFICLYILNDSNLTETFNIDKTLIIKSCIILFLETIFILLTGYFGIIIGHKSNNKKILKSIIIAIVSYFIMQALTLLLILLYGTINPDFMNLFTNQNANIETLEKILTFSIIIYLIYNSFLYIISKKCYLKGINID